MKPGCARKRPAWGMPAWKGLILLPKLNIVHCLSQKEPQEQPL